MFFTGIVLIVISKWIRCPAQTIEYRYLPRNLLQQMTDENQPETIKPMFDDEDIYLKHYNRHKLGQNNINFLLKSYSY